MRIEINTELKTIKILEECTIKELEIFMQNIENHFEYKIISDIRYNYYEIPNSPVITYYSSGSDPYSPLTFTISN